MYALTRKTERELNDIMENITGPSESPSDTSKESELKSFQQKAQQILKATKENTSLTELLKENAFVTRPDVPWKIVNDEGGRPNIAFHAKY